MSSRISSGDHVALTVKPFDDYDDVLKEKSSARSTTKRDGMSFHLDIVTKNPTFATIVVFIITAQLGYIVISIILYTGVWIFNTVTAIAHAYPIGDITSYADPARIHSLA